MAAESDTMNMRTCRMLSSATEATTHSSEGLQAKSDTLLVCPPWMNSSCRGAVLCLTRLLHGIYTCVCVCVCTHTIIKRLDSNVLTWCIMCSMCMHVYVCTRVRVCLIEQ